MAKQADASHHHAAAPSSWVLNPAAILFAVCLILVFATATPAARGELVTIVAVAVVAFFAGRLSRRIAGSESAE